MQRRLIYLLVAMVSICWLCAVPAARAAQSIPAARAQATQLQARLAALNAQMAQVASRYNVTAQRLAVVDVGIAANQHKLALARYELAAARAALAARVVAMYKAPTSGFLDVALAATSFDDLVSRVHLWGDVFEQGQLAVASVQRAKVAVQQQGNALAGSRRQVVALLGQVAVQRRELAGEVQRGQGLLAAAQVKVRTLVRQAQARRAAALAAARARAAAARRAAAAARKAAAEAARQAATAASQTSSASSAASPPGASDYSPSTLARPCLATSACRSPRRT